MADMKSWLKKIKNRILKKDLDDDELPDLITPTSEAIEVASIRVQKETQKPRKEAMMVKEMHGEEKIIYKNFQYFANGSKRTSET